MAAGQLNSFLDRLFQYVPADKQGEARSTYSSLADRIAALETNEARVRETAQRQTQWWEANKDAVTERDRLATELAEAKKTQPGATVDENAIERRIREAQAQTLETGLGLVTAITNLAVQHQMEFGEALDTRKLAEQAIAANLPVDQFYAQSVQQRRTERVNAEIEKKVAAAREEGITAGRQEVMSRLPGGALPFPSPSQAPTTLAGLKKPEAGAANPFSLEAAVATANAVAAEQNR